MVEGVLRLRTLSVLLVLCAFAVLAPAAARATPYQHDARVRMLDAWLDIQLVSIFYPDTDPTTLAANLQLVAQQLGQPPLMIRHGAHPADAYRFSVHAVVIQSGAPATTLILFARSDRGAVWRLTDAGDGLHVVCVLHCPAAP